MDIEDVVDLLTIIAVGDHRTIGESDAREWHRMLSELDKDDCVDAITAHRRELPGVWLEPGHIIARVKAMKRDRLNRMDPDQAALVSSAPAQFRDRFGHVDKVDPGFDEIEYHEDWTPEQRRRAYWDRINRMREQREYRMARLLPGLSGAPATFEARAAAIADMATKRLQTMLDDTDTVDDLPYVNPRLVRCDFCNSAPGDHCTMPAMPGASRDPRQKLSVMSHPSRIEKAAIKAGYTPEVAAILAGGAAKQHLVRRRAGWTQRDQAAGMVIGSSKRHPEVIDGEVIDGEVIDGEVVDATQAGT